MAVKLSEDAIPGVGNHWADRDRSGSSRYDRIRATIVAQLTFFLIKGVEPSFSCGCCQEGGREG